MTLMAGRLQALSWLALVFVVLVALYPLSLSVAAQRSDLLRVERDIARTRAEIRYLETEFATRASLRQLETWNELDYGYVAPTAAQYLESERELANLGNPDRLLDQPVRVAAMTVNPDEVETSGTIGAAVAARPAALARAEAPTLPAKAKATASPARAAFALAEAPKVDASGIAAGTRALGDTVVDRRLINKLKLQATIEGLGGDGQ